MSFFNHLASRTLCSPYYLNFGDTMLDPSPGSQNLIFDPRRGCKPMLMTPPIFRDAVLVIPPGFVA
ncbi:G-type lectin S-receptor-like serine/threonine-protein kinase, partial [Clarias magur]